ncbi:MAG TPA: hypothetical protein VGO47_01540 [Chlamydiales bacterium]|nr:hypothetical protein [Chlamydiales bacterium]
MTLSPSTSAFSWNDLRDRANTDRGVPATSLTLESWTPPQCCRVTVQRGKIQASGCQNRTTSFPPFRVSGYFRGVFAGTQRNTLCVGGDPCDGWLAAAATAAPSGQQKQRRPPVLHLTIDEPLP